MKKTLTAALLGLALVGAGCGTEPDNENTGPYPQEARDNFVDACTSTATRTGGGNEEEQRRTCTCIVDNLEETLPYDRKEGDNSFKDADEAIKEGKPIPSEVEDKIDQATADCRPDS
jgi:hypothetical protein